MTKFGQAKRYMQYLLRSKSKYKVHSPFVFELITEVLPDEHPFHSWEHIEHIRKKLLNSSQTIEVRDFGAGSKVFNSNTRPVSGIAQYALQPAERGQLLFRLVNRFKPTTILELGTSLGITTAYLASVDSKARVWTLEGCPNTLAIAQDVFEELELTNITAVEGPFTETLPGVLAEMEQLDFAFIDGHHAKKPTLNYFEQCLAKCHNDTILVFDDIHWSEDMEAAWETIKAHPKVRVTMDLFWFGLVSFRTEQEPEHFILRY